MISIDCPFCDADAMTDDGLTTVSCEACGVSVDVAPDGPAALDAAA